MLDRSKAALQRALVAGRLTVADFKRKHSFLPSDNRAAAHEIQEAVHSSCIRSSDGNGGGQGAVTPPPGQQTQTITAVVDFIKNLIASNGENTDPIDINALTLAADDNAEPAAVE